MSKHTAIIGMQWGDEGKGKIIDALAPGFDVVVRYQGGANAGHTVVVGKEKFALHLIPSGILQAGKTCVIADGVIVHPRTLLEELTDIKKRVKKTARLLVSTKVNLVMPWHLVRDGIAGGAIGTTMRGIGPTYIDATGRRGIRVMDWLDPKRFKTRVAEEVAWNKSLIATMCKHYKLTTKQKSKLHINAATNAAKITRDYLGVVRKLQKLEVEWVDGSAWLSGQAEKKRILFEGAQATLLDITHGDYPYVTSSHPTIGGLYIGCGMRPRDLQVVGVVKAYATRVGNGPFATELSDKIGEGLRERGHEFGTTTGRPRRCGWLDVVALRYALRVNGVDQIAMTKLDVLAGEKTLKMATAYMYKGKKITEYPADVRLLEQCKPVYEQMPGFGEDITGARKFADLPKTAQAYVKRIEKLVGVPIAMIGVGPGREELITRASRD